MLVDSKYTLPKLGRLCLSIRYQDVDQALQVFFEAGASKSNRALQVLTANALVALQDSLDLCDVTAWGLFTQLSHRVDRTYSLCKHCVAKKFAHLTA